MCSQLSSTPSQNSSASEIPFQLVKAKHSEIIIFSDGGFVVSVTPDSTGAVVEFRIQCTSMGGCNCSHQAANGPFLGRNLRHSEGVSSNYYLRAMDRYLGFTVRLPISGQGNLVTVVLFPFQPSFGDSKNSQSTLTSLPSPPQGPALSPCSVVRVSAGKQHSGSPVNDPVIYGDALSPPPPMPNTALGLGQPRVEKRLVGYLYGIHLRTVLKQHK